MSEVKYWNDRWTEGKTGWDLAAPHIAMPSVREHMLKQCQTPRVYVPGCGRAHDAAWLAQNGCAVTAADFSPRAIEEARTLYGGIDTLTLEIADATTVPEAPGGYDAIYDRAMLCALRPALRLAYVHAMHQRLNPGGLFCSLIFHAIPVTDSRPLGSGPPFQINLMDFVAEVQGRFALQTVQAFATNWPDGRGLAEMLTISRKLNA